MSKKEDNTKKKSFSYGGLFLILGIILVITGTYLVRYVALAPKNAKEMFEKAKVDAVIDFNGKADINFNMDNSLEVPMALTFEGTYGLKEAGLHVNSMFSMELFKNKSYQKMSFYGEKMTSKDAVLYMNTGKDWSELKSDKMKVSDIQSGILSLFSLLNQNESILKDSVFTSDGGRNDKYVVTQEFAALAKNSVFNKWITDMVKKINLPDDSDEKLDEIMKSGSISYVFDKYYHLQQIRISDVSATQKANLSALMGEGSENVDLTMTFGFVIEFNDAKDVSVIQIPDEVRNADNTSTEQENK